jgi:hypothetical protein
MTGILSGAYNIYSSGRESTARGFAQCARHIAPQRLIDSCTAPVKNVLQQATLFPEVRTTAEPLTARVMQNLTANMRVARAVATSLETAIETLGRKRVEDVLASTASRGIDVLAVGGAILTVPFAVCGAVPTATMCATGAGSVLTTSQAMAGSLAIVGGTSVVSRFTADEWKKVADKKGITAEDIRGSSLREVLKERFIGAGLAHMPGAFRALSIDTIPEDAIFRTTVHTVVHSFLNSLYERCADNNSYDIIDRLWEDGMLSSLIGSIVTGLHRSSFDTYNGFRELAGLQQNPLFLRTDQLQENIGRVLDGLEALRNAPEPRDRSLVELRGRIQQLQGSIDKALPMLPKPGYETAEVPLLSGDQIRRLRNIVEGLNGKVQALKAVLHRAEVEQAKANLRRLHEETEGHFIGWIEFAQQFSTKGPEEQEIYKRAFSDFKKRYETAIKMYEGLNGPREDADYVNASEDLRAIDQLLNHCFPGWFRSWATVFSKTGDVLSLPDVHAIYERLMGRRGGTGAVVVGLPLPPPFLGIAVPDPDGASDPGQRLHGLLDEADRGIRGLRTFIEDHSPRPSSTRLTPRPDESGGVASLTPRGVDENGGGESMIPGSVDESGRVELVTPENTDDNDQVEALLPGTDDGDTSEAEALGDTTAASLSAEAVERHIQEEIQRIRALLREASELLIRLRGSDGFSGEVDRQWRQYFSVFQNTLCSMISQGAAAGLTMPVTADSCRSVDAKQRNGQMLLQSYRDQIVAVLEAASLDTQGYRGEIERAHERYRRAHDEYAQIGGDGYDGSGRPTVGSLLARLESELATIESSVS